jgi:hypothetical protein
LPWSKYSNSPKVRSKLSKDSTVQPLKCTEMLLQLGVCNTEIDRVEEGKR